MKTLPASKPADFVDAEKRTRTSTPLRGLEPESSASANSAISACLPLAILVYTEVTTPAPASRSDVWQMSDRQTLIAYIKPRHACPAILIRVCEVVPGP